MSNAIEPALSVSLPSRPTRSAGGSFEKAVSAALEGFAREHQESLHNSGPALRMSTADGGQSFLTSIIGSSGQQLLIISAPKDADGRTVELQPEQHWIFRTIHHTTALRFEGVVKNIVEGAAPHAYVELTGAIERRVVRKAARVAVAIRATLLPSLTHALLIDLSIGGARFAIDGDTPLDLGHSIVCSTALTIGDRLYALELKGSVLSREAPMPKHPRVAVYRLRFDSLSDLSFLVLQAYLSTQLVEELDSFWRLVAGPLR